MPYWAWKYATTVCRGSEGGRQQKDRQVLASTALIALHTACTISLGQESHESLPCIIQNSQCHTCTHTCVFPSPPLLLPPPPDSPPSESPLTVKLSLLAGWSDSLVSLTDCPLPYCSFTCGHVHEQSSICRNLAFTWAQAGMCCSKCLWRGLNSL